MRYYLIQDDMWLDESSDRWIFDRLKHEGPSANYEYVDPPAEFMEPCIYPVDLYRIGKATDFSFTMDSGNIPIVSEKVVLALKGLKEIDEPYRFVVFERVEVENYKITDPYFVMIIETQLDCVDEDRSDFQIFEENDPVRPDLAGNYRGFFNLVIDPSKVGDHHIFRIKKHLSSIIVSEVVKERIEKVGATGIVFESVNGDLKAMA